MWDLYSKFNEFEDVNTNIIPDQIYQLLIDKKKSKVRVKKTLTY